LRLAIDRQGRGWNIQDNMDKVMAFIHAFIKQEYSSLIVEKTEPDFESYMAAIKALSPYCLPGLAGNFIGRRPLEPDADWYQDEAAAQTAYRKRTLLRIEQYKHRKLGMYTGVT